MFKNLPVCEIKIMKIKKLLFIPVILAPMLLAGCASQSKRIVDLNLNYLNAKNAPVNTTDRNAQAQLANAATSVSHTSQQLSAVQMATHPGIKMPKPINPGATGMTKIASLNWTGPAKPVVSRIANISHYRLHVLGSRPATPIIVNINAKNKPIAEILRNIKYQIAGKAVIKVFPRQRIIELRYFNQS